MARIEVNHATLRKVAQDITSYCDAQDAQMRRANQSVKALTTTYWVGLDSEAFDKKWAEIDGDSSVAHRFREALKGYAANLNACADAYREAQAKAYSAACRLPKHGK